MFLSHTDRHVLYNLANDILHKLFEYCSANKIIINYEKCCFIEFSTSKTNTDVNCYTIKIINHCISRVNECKFLGVIINSNLDWKSQIKHVKTQVAKASGAINSIKKIVPAKMLRNIYFALVQPYLVYCVPIWGSIHNSAEFNDLFKVQKRAIRIISNRTFKVNHRFVNTKPLFTQHNILTVHNLYYYLLSIAAFKILNNKAPVIIYNEFSISYRSIRLILPKFRLHTLANKSFSFSASKLINFLLSLDVSYVGYTLQSFKTKLKRTLMFRQGLCLNSDPNWLPNNTNIYSDVAIN